MYNRELSIFVQLLEASHRRMKAKVFIDLAHRLSRNTNSRTVFVIGIVTIRHDSIHTVVAARQLDNNQYPFRFTCFKALVNCSECSSSRLKEGGQAGGNAEAIQAEA